MNMQGTLRAMRMRAGLRQRDVAEALGLDPSAVSQWETGRTLPDRDRIPQLARLYGCSEQVFFADQNDDGEPAEQVADNAVRPSPNVAMIDGEFADPDAGPTHGWRSATVPLVAVEDSAEEAAREDMVGRSVEVPVSVLHEHPHAQATRVEDDSMSRVAPRGSIAVFDPDLLPTSGHVAIAQTIDGRALIRRWYKGQNTVMLAAESHTHYDDVVFTDEAMPHVVGTVVYVQGPPDLL